MDWISDTNAHHISLDGVPMKINNIFRPKSFQNTLPQTLRVRSNDSKALKVAYMFETEKGYLKWHNDLAEEKRRENEEKLRRKQLELDKAVDRINKSNNQDSVTTAVHKEVPREPSLPAISNTILQPHRASPINFSKAPSTHGIYANVKDFDNLSEDPFNSVELNTLDVKEELKRVLLVSQTQSTSSMTNDKVQTGDITETDGKGHVTFTTGDIYENLSDLKLGDREDSVVIQSNDCDVILKQTESKNHSCDAKSRPASGHFKAPVPLPRSTSTAEPVDKTYENVSECLADPPMPQISSGKPKVSPKPTVLPKPGGTNKHPQKPKGALTGNTPQVPSYSSANVAQSLANQKIKGFSYTQLSNAEVKEELQKIQWPKLDSDLHANPSENNLDIKKPGASSSAKSSSSVDDSTGSAQTVYKDIPDRKPQRPPPPLPNKSLSSTDPAKVTDRLLSMGFDRKYINDAVRHYGCDMTKLTEHLCYLQQLTSEGIQWQNAQEALFLFNTDLVQASKFVKPYQQLLEAGFKADHVKEALLKSNMDADKAIDQLVTI